MIVKEKFHQNVLDEEILVHHDIYRREEFANGLIDWKRISPIDDDHWSELEKEYQRCKRASKMKIIAELTIPDRILNKKQIDFKGNTYIRIEYESGNVGWENLTHKIENEDFEEIENIFQKLISTKSKNNE